MRVLQHPLQSKLLNIRAKVNIAVLVDPHHGHASQFLR
jgi:hypothetical protein